MRIKLIALIILMLMAAAPASAEIPQTMHVQGVLTDTLGNRLNGPYTVVFQIYDQEAGGTEIWTETILTDVADGLFSVTLGTINPLNLPFDQQYWLGIAIDGEPEFQPRMALASAPYALNAISSMAGLQPGEDLIVRDSMGSTTHLLKAQGGATFSGTTRFGNDADTGIIIRSPDGPALVVLAGDFADSAATAALRTVFGDGSANSTQAIDVRTTDGEAISGTSIGGHGVGGQSVAGHGVIGGSELGSGTHGFSDEGAGASGSSVNGPGGDFFSFNGTGVRASGQPAGNFLGDVHVKGEVYARSLHVVEFDSDGTIKEYLTNFNSDGTSEHFGRETYRGGIDLVASNLNLKPTDGANARVVLDPTPSTSVPAIFSSGPAKFAMNASDPPTVSLNPFSTALNPAIKAIGHVKIQRDADDTDPPVMVLAPTSDNSAPAVEIHGKTQSNGPVVVNDVLFVQDDPVSPMRQLVVDPSLSESGYHWRMQRMGLTAYADFNRIAPVIDVSKLQNPSLAGDNGSEQVLQTLRKELTPLRSPHGSGTTTKSEQAFQLPVLQVFSDLTEGTGLQAWNANFANTATALEGINSGGGAGVLGRVSNQTSAYPGVWAVTTGQGPAFLIDHQGSAGDLALMRDKDTNRVRIDKTGKGFFNGGTQTGGADIAEAFEVEGATHLYEPGDVIVISEHNDRTVAKSAVAYSRLVVGVYATRPGVLLTERHIDDDLTDAIPVGVIGILPTKVTTENGPIRRGDLLVTSRTPGHAMRGTEANRMQGATIGKALEEFDADRPGVIRVLVNAK